MGIHTGLPFYCSIFLPIGNFLELERGEFLEGGILFCMILRGFLYMDMITFLAHVTWQQL